MKNCETWYTTYRCVNNAVLWGTPDHGSPDCWESRRCHRGNGWPPTTCIGDPCVKRTARGTVSSFVDAICVPPKSSCVCSR